MQDFAPFIPRASGGLGCKGSEVQDLRSVIGSYRRSWERPCVLPRVIEILCLFVSGRSPGLSQQRM